jgi:hypothetical protein
VAAIGDDPADADPVELVHGTDTEIDPGQIILVR